MQAQIADIAEQAAEIAANSSAGEIATLLIGSDKIL